MNVRNVFLTIAALALASSASMANPAIDCGRDAAAALREAQAALATDDGTHDRKALICLTAAVISIDTRLSGLSSGTLPFDGQILLPKGFAISKPSIKEAR